MKEAAVRVLLDMAVVALAVVTYLVWSAIWEDEFAAAVGAIVLWSRVRWA